MTRPKVRPILNFIQHKKTKGLDTYHYRIQLKYSRMKAHLHERSSWMLQSTLIYDSNSSWSIT